MRSLLLAFLASADTLVGKLAPTFVAEAVYPDGKIANLDLASFRGKYVVLFFYPLDFTFVCPTELLSFDDMMGDFHERDTEVIGVSIDSVHTHAAWRRTKK